MTKSDLKSGMVVECKNKERYIVTMFKEQLYLISEDNWISLRNFDESLKCFSGDSYSIQKVYPVCVSGFNLMIRTNCKPIWERKEPKKMTVEEICRVLGYEVEIVK